MPIHLAVQSDDLQALDLVASPLTPSFCISLFRKLQAFELGPRESKPYKILVEPITHGKLWPTTAVQTPASRAPAEDPLSSSPENNVRSWFGELRLPAELDPDFAIPELSVTVSDQDQSPLLLI